MKVRWLRAARLAGTALSVAGIAFLVYALIRDDVLQHATKFPVTVLLGSLLIYVAGLGCLQAAWVSFLGEDAVVVPHARLRWIYGRSVLAKYIPGNVFQFVSRQVDLAAFGLGQLTVAKASMREIASQALAACGVALSLTTAVGGDIWLPLAGFADADALRLFAVVLWALIAAAVIMSRRIPLKGFLFHLLFFLVFELVGLWLLVHFVKLKTVAAAAGCFSLAWLVGFVVIGAPGGIGVREATLITLLHTYAPDSAAAVIALALRAITVTGDVAYGALTYFHASSSR